MHRVLAQVAAEQWLFRWQVERDAEQRFLRLAERIDRFDPSSPVIALLRQAASDERHHAGLCAGLAESYGAQLPSDPPSPPGVAPSHLSERDQVLYELVAASCITETESNAVLLELLPAAQAEPLRAVLHTIARDEVKHAQLGWAHLAREAQDRDVSFLSPLIPAMLKGTVSSTLFEPPAHPAADDPRLLQFGVLPHAVKRKTFCEALREVIFPGLETLGVDSAPARRWLDEQA